MSADELFDRANEAWDAGKRRQAFRLFSQAAAKGHASAHNSLGYFYYHGIAVGKDSDKALFWYRKAARRGDVSAYKNLALMYQGAGNINRAKFWFAKALARRDGDAALELAKLWLRGPRPNVDRASKYLKIAARSKYILSDSKEEARKLLKKLTRTRPA
jgi:uncharacterized protein